MRLDVDHGSALSLPRRRRRLDQGCSRWGRAGTFGAEADPGHVPQEPNVPASAPFDCFQHCPAIMKLIIAAATLSPWITIDAPDVGSPTKKCLFVCAKGLLNAPGRRIAMNIARPAGRDGCLDRGAAISKPLGFCR
jgi:hypothetical protein